MAVQRMVTIFMIAFLGTISAACAWAAEADLLAPQVPEGWMVIEEQDWMVLTDEPTGYFLEAYEDFLKGDLQSAGMGIRKAAALVKVEWRRANRGVDGTLATSVKELEELAREIERGAIVRAVKLEVAFERAKYALAQHHYHKALEYEAKKANLEMAYSLHAAATHLLDASAWGDYELERDDIMDIKDARAIGQKMIQGIRCDSKTVAEAMKHIGRGIQQLGKKIRPALPGPQAQSSPECDGGPALLV